MAATESGRARARRLLGETRCECGAPAEISSHQENEGYIHECFRCAFGIVRYTPPARETPVVLPEPPTLAEEFHVTSIEGDHENPVRLKGYKRQRIRRASRGGTYASPHNEKAVWMRPTGKRGTPRATRNTNPETAKSLAELMKELGL